MYNQYRDGWIEVICGCMFSGKTVELIRRVQVLSYAKKNILAFKPALDDRYSSSEIMTHTGTKIPCNVIKEAKEILNYVDDKCDVVAIDEIQFFNEDMIEVLEYLANKGIRVIVAGLDQNFRGEPFGIIPDLMTRAEFVTKLTAVCAKCGSPATRTQRLVNNEPAAYEEPVILVGSKETYEPRCRHCHKVRYKQKIIQ